MRRTLISLSLIALTHGCDGFDEQDEPDSIDPRLYVSSQQVWRNPVIEVCWENPNAFDATERAWVQDAVGVTWGAHSYINLHGWGTCLADSKGIRIKIDDAHPHTKGLGAALDGVADGMVLNFSFKNWGQSCQNTRQFCISTIAVHEFGHALGFSHEQNRADTPSQFCGPGEGPQGTNGDMTIGAWDLDSVMNYCNPEWSGHGQLSEADKAGVRQVYGHLYWKWYGDAAGPSSDFTSYQPARFSSGDKIIPMDFSGDGRDDILIFRPKTGAFRKCYGDPSDVVQSEFYGCQSWRYIGGLTETYVDAQMIPADYNGDGQSDLVVFQPSSGRFWKWYGDGGVPSPDFNYQGERYIGGAPGSVTGAQMIPADFSGDGKTDIIVFQPSSGAFWKWYGDTGAPSSDFGYQGQRYIGGYHGAVKGAQMLPADFNGDGKIDVLVFQPSSGAFWKWYGDSDAIKSKSDFGYQGQRYIGGAPGLVVGAQMIPTDFNGDGKTDILVFRASDGAFWKWYSDNGASLSDFQYQQARYIGGAPGAVKDAQMIPADFNGDGKSDVLVFRPSDGAFWKWYGDNQTPHSDFQYQQLRYIGGAPGAVKSAKMIPADFNGDLKSDMIVLRSL